MRLLLIPLCAILAIGIHGPPVAASAECHWSTSDTDVDVTLGATRIYVQHNAPFQEDLAWIVVYEESNGLDGLQRADPVIDNTCGGQIPGDRPIFT